MNPPATPAVAADAPVGALRLLLVDDEAPARARLRELLADVADEVPNTVVGEAADGVAALAAIDAGGVDVALVDIRMPLMDGIEFARHVRNCAQPPAVIFVTAFDNYAVQAFELNAIDYLLKPVRATRLAAALQRARGQRPVPSAALSALGQRARTHLSCRERGRLLLLPLAEIVYLKAELKYVTARTAARDYLIDEPLAALEAEFAERFVRVHRSALVARAAIAGFVRAEAADNATIGEGDAQWQVILTGLGERLPVSRRQWPQLKAFARQLAS
ncbi:LytR/AlgR family response regulator transcription factor [Rhodocyclus tenuis]|uniref:Two-component system response regulator AlgR n=1 Tax=Rhodocyclus tenuis TaxID=1066 RepID=A0A840G3A3_RHOTE|nr:LytTR family DNA-binding domain-containing protein [Rhodocyclus tenuis]MBB4245781.1 two-component system response regulator AlgR [Rhodocyclus tenuis]